MANERPGVDASSPCSKTTVECLTNAGITFVCRYYSRTTKIKGKKITTAEAKRLSAAGIEIVAVYEDGPTAYKYFSASRGSKDANGALEQASGIGQPEGSAIYFAIDYDAAKSEIAGNITRYFEAVKKTIDGRYAIGVYGSGAACAAMLDAGLATYAWLAQSTGWSGYKKFTDWSIKQGPEETVCKLNSDTDIGKADIGGFLVA